MRVLVATDAWHPQVNGVVRTLTSLARSARNLGVDDRIPVAGRLSVDPAADLSGIAPRAAEPPRDRRAHRAGRAGRDPHRDRRPDRPRGARLLPAPRPAVHHELHDALSRIYLGALPIPRSAELCGAAPLPCRRRRHDGGDAVADERADERGFRNLGMWTRGVDTDLFRARPRHRCSISAADLRQRRARRGREEPRSVPVARPAGHQGRDRRRAAGSRAAAALPDAKFLGLLEGRQARRASGGGRRVRVPEPHRHVRRRAARGARLRRAGRGLSGHRPAGRHRRPSGRRARRRSARGLPRRAERLARGLPRLRAAHSWETAPASSSAHLASRTGARARAATASRVRREPIG